ncbi:MULTISPECIES: hypothetical protein [Alteromonadaceae]|uniref:hypothetical protein n=1 Tax=Alteromonadaceae TaxID=72275 RepID=UPI001C084F45|nr:hypothetical protein [Aliiglaciecola lipolytica]MBU2878570.1 hypothetical protein [Aliiglaciecola lipolytica]
MDFERQQHLPTKTKNNSLRKVLFISVLAHGLIGWWILSQQRIIIPTKIEQEVSAINAKLVFLPAPKVVEEAAEIETVEPLSEPEALAKPDDNQQKQQADQVIEDVEVTEIEVSETLPPADTIEPNEAPEIVEQVTPQIPPIENDSRREDLPSIDFPDKTNTDTQVETSRNLAQKHLLDHSAQANQRMAEQEAQRYRQQRESPDLNLPKFDPFKTDDEKLRESNSVRVDCSSTVNKTIAVLSTFTGGSLDCSKPTDLAPFLDKHVKKPMPPKDKR